jgi:ADP-ribose pyrophosphatase
LADQQAKEAEMPTGGVGSGERIADAAQRELGEESGYRAGRLEPVSVYHTSRASWTRRPTWSSPST